MVRETASRVSRRGRPRRQENAGPSPDQLRRLRFIERAAMWTGQVGRRAVASAFDVSVGHVTQDFQRYRAMAPSNLAYDVARKCFRRTDDFRPVFGAEEPAQLLAMIAASAHLSSQDQARLLGFAIPVETAGPLPAAIDPDLLLNVCRAITLGELLDITYQSMNSPEPVDREFAPRALIFTGQRWLVRGWDCRHQDFRDLALARILNAEAQGAAEPLPRDDYWHDQIRLEIGLKDGLSQSQADVSAREFGMKKRKGEYRVELSARKAMVPYILDNLPIGTGNGPIGALPLKLVNYNAIRQYDRPNANRGS